MKSKLLLIVSVCIAMVSCTKDTEDQTSLSSTALNTMSTSDGLVLMRTTSIDENNQWRIKMNDVAAKALSENIKNFPNNSLIVKEKINSAGEVTGYATMLKTSGDHNASNGWIWTEFGKNGEVIYNEGERGANCQSCHAQTNVQLY
jgi:hypothetical protein